MTRHIYFGLRWLKVGTVKLALHAKKKSLQTVDSAQCSSFFFSCIGQLLVCTNGTLFFSAERLPFQAPRLICSGQWIVYQLLKNNADGSR